MINKGEAKRLPILVIFSVLSSDSPLESSTDTFE